MKKVYFSFGMMALLVILSSSIFSTESNSTQVDELPPPPDSLYLDLQEEPLDYEVEFPQHIFESLGDWGTDISTINAITNNSATLGRVLFYDVRLSGDNTLSCASCHNQSLSFTDSLALSNGIDGQFTTRNSMQLNDLGWQPSFGFFWDRRAFSLEEAVLQPILASHELGKNMPNLINKLENSEYYPSLFEAAFDSPEITSDGIANALAHFIASMTTFNTRFDQEIINPGSTLTESELNGLALFQQSCEFCHFGPHFGAGFGGIFFQPGNNGLDSVFTDIGAGEFWGEEYNGVFKGPSLRNIAQTGPFMHDGRFQSLQEVVDFYSEDIVSNATSTFDWIFGDTFTGFQFDDEQKADLIAFMNALTDEDFLQNEKWSNPWKTIVGFQPIPELDGVQVYPNPVSDKIHIEIADQSPKEYLINLYNVKGQLVQTIQTEESHSQIFRGVLPAGVYQLKISDGILSKSVKLIFE